MRKLNLLFVMLLSLMGVTQVNAETLTANFNRNVGLPEGWSLVGDVTNDDTRGRNNTYGLWTSSKSTTANYVITEAVEGTFEFYARAYNKSYASTVDVYEYNGTGLGKKLYSTNSMYSSSTPSWAKYSFTVESGSQLAIVLNYAAIDDVTYTQYVQAEGAALTVFDEDNNKMSDGDAIDFGVTTSEATKTFSLKNSGTIDYSVTISATGNFAVSPESAEIVAGGEQEVTITMPEVSAEGVITITPSVDGLEPFTINVSGKIVPVMEVSLDGTEIADGFTDRFGKVSENATHTYTVSNLGTAVLNVAIASDNEEFVVSPAFLEVDPANSATFDVTFKFNAENVGARTANITITPSIDVNAPVSFSVIANVADPNVWSEDFEGEGQPEGWEAGTGWTFADGVAHGKYTYGSNTYVTTPALQAEAGSTLDFQYKATANYVSIKIQASKDGAEFVDFKTISGLNTMSEFETYTLDIPEAGVYKFRFANDDYDLDNFEGLKEAVLEHDMAITASDIPSSGDTASEYVASVTVQEKAGKDETVTAKLYIDGNVVATAEQEVAANEEAIIELSFEPTEAVVFKKAYIEITYAEGLTKKTDEVSVYIQEVTVKVLDEVAVNEFSGTTETYDRVKLNYTVKQGWNTIAVPFMINDLSVFGENVQAYQFSDYADGELKFSRTTMIPAATPCVFYTEAPSTKQITFDRVTIYSYNAVEEDCAVTNGEATFQGTYAPIAAPGMQGKYGVVPSTGKIQKGGAGASIKALRAYFILPENVDGSKLIMTFVEEEGDATSIKGIENLNIENAEMFDLSGRKVIGQKKAGIYILNGKKVVVK